MHLSWPGGPLSGTAQLPASKSEANRALILQALAGGGTIDNLSDANDTQLMQRLLKEAPHTDVLDAEDAGTVMRFLTAYLAVTGWKGRLTGTARAQERPIAVLVDALRKAGASITYLKAEGYPPLEFGGFSASASPTELSVRGDISSQYISALLMLGPMLPGGLRLTLTGQVGSLPYIYMTVALMRHFCTAVLYENRTLEVLPDRYRPADYTVEADWSAASYWYSLVALAPAGSEITLPGLRRWSFQGDQAIAKIMAQFGVETTFLPDAVHLKQQPLSLQAEIQTIDFTDCPDLAQTVAVVAVALKRPVDLTGLESLRIKETDRIAALQTELAKFGGDLRDLGDGRFRAESNGFSVANQSVATYHDHRMAMAFAPLALRGPLHIEAPTVVRKSYPQFWNELAKAGFIISEGG
ncbi:3-phosphoshikimate 1-carboxyvinyltransferase [Hymenobacter properus]|uniref:3-phosphoshikimate 1-carboxyvinyltransferase n=1 Tax=Hymenobacter properus TaxID=2791026 RepID=A0A931BPQ6_9BACT|nr:3-phosphoshikimate 1-carboxyvinyltransferase [Hymenobacter properus]MBF9143350.1 3-phosphoshikimate 1-carboxyvinyltransferase [Hymenobacter properus]MBR7722160.1 3-phosphoshikimate 1-carboxyvinyltransferase [Microvirga sp. SRT04]